MSIRLSNLIVQTFIFDSPQSKSMKPYILNLKTFLSSFLSKMNSLRNNECVFLYTLGLISFILSIN